MSLGARGWQLFRLDHAARTSSGGSSTGSSSATPARWASSAPSSSSPATSPARPTRCRSGSRSSSRSTTCPGAFAVASVPGAARARHAAREDHARVAHAPRARRAQANADSRRRGMSITVKNVTQAVRQLRRPRRREPRGARRASCWRSSARRAPARRRCSASSRVSRSPTAAPSTTRTRTCTDAAVRERNVGFVFQHYALFRHMTVFDNVALRPAACAKRAEGADPRPRARAPPRWCSSKASSARCRRSSRAASASASRSRALAARAEGAAPRRAVRRARREGAHRSSASGSAACTTRST